jgi:hypothetical protein
MTIQAYDTHHAQWDCAMDDPRVMIRQMALAMRTSRSLYVAAEWG